MLRRGSNHRGTTSNPRTSMPPLGRLAKCELDKVGREISPCTASVPRSAIGRPSAPSF